MNFRISGQKINILKETKYLGMTMDEHLTFKNHMDTVKLKLNKENKLLAKLRHFVNPTLLRTIYYTIFEPNLLNSQMVRQKCLFTQENLDQ